ncbi:hypoxanthine phosphoribosyltransferase [Mesonia hippocampi]|uniref:Hypoxanthine phosphoribosyltransferase n=1 Tax=Mesonia hippocampi TaxID=1628250 RepID=A0A840EUE7_9FLAO|nr:phosphoribosyltransferase family protein [Mesonia hippocampi]MBB4119086.1 hypoxanthine phosphoribosyltransferase [Mesonia hippocampi]
MKVETLDEKQVSIALTQLVQEIDFRPELIVGILNGSAEIIKYLKQQDKFSESVFYQVKLQRKQETVKRKKIMRFLAKQLPYFIVDFLRKLESAKARKSIAAITKENLEKTKIIPIEIAFKKEPQTILIIDDAIDTGKTMYVVKKQLQQKFPKATVYVACIAWTLTEAIVKPDYFWKKEVLIRYPWSKDYKSRKNA